MVTGQIRPECKQIDNHLAKCAHFLLAFFFDKKPFFDFKCPPFDFYRICEARPRTGAREYVTLIALRFGNFSLCSDCGLSECTLPTVKIFGGTIPPPLARIFFYAIAKCAHSKRVRSTKFNNGPNFLLSLNCVCGLNVPETMQARRVNTLSIEQCVYARSAYGCLVTTTFKSGPMNARFASLF